MFKWFFGDPAKRAERGYRQLIKAIHTLRRKVRKNQIAQCKGDINNTINLLNKLNTEIDNLYSSAFNIKEKFEKLDKEIVKEHRIENVILSLDGYKGDIKKKITDALGSSQIIKREIGGKTFFSSEEIEKIEEIVQWILLTFESTQGILGYLKEMIKQYDFLEHIHLEPHEVEFYTMRKRKKTYKFPNVEVYLKPSLKYIIIKKGDKISKHDIKGSETGPTHWDKHINKLSGKKYSKGEAQFCESIKKREEVLKYEEKVLAEFKGKFNERNNQFNLFCEFSKEIGISDLHKNGNWKRTRWVSVWFKPDGENYVYHGFPADPDEVDIQNKD